jgi:NAD(P)-dependent dehydrogenase (short-subunit alcohol dehydrogenase family)
MTGVNQPRLAGMPVIITGAGGGIGRATAIWTANEGARLGLTDLDPASLRETQRAVQAAGGEALAVAGDVVDPATIDALATAVTAEFGGIGGLVNNAGIARGGPLLELSVEDFELAMRVNCLSCLLTTQRVAATMRAGGSGSIVNVASVGALVALPDSAAYSASKAAVVALTRSVALDLAPAIRCNVVCPGGVDTPMAQSVIASFGDAEAATAALTGRQMLKRFAAAEEIASVIAFLLSADASFMTGAVLPVEAGHTAG